MRTAIMILVGVVLALGFDLVTAALNKRRAAPAVDGGRLFILIWLGIMIVDFYIGVSEGNTVPLELGVHALVFAIPTGMAWWLARRRRPRPVAPR
jgi:hypothetical protein